MTLSANSNHCKQIISLHSEMGRTTDSDQLKQAQLCIPAPVPPPHQPKLISIRIVAGTANHTSLLKMNYISERLRSLNEVTVSLGEKA